MVRRCGVQIPLGYTELNFKFRSCGHQTSPPRVQANCTLCQLWNGECAPVTVSKASQGTPVGMRWWLKCRMEGKVPTLGFIEYYHSKTCALCSELVVFSPVLSSTSTVVYRDSSVQWQEVTSTQFSCFTAVLHYTGLLCVCFFLKKLSGS